MTPIPSSYLARDLYDRAFTDPDPTPVPESPPGPPRRRAAWPAIARLLAALAPSRARAA